MGLWLTRTSLLELSRQAQGELLEDRAEHRSILAAAELLEQLPLQDVERTGDGIFPKDGASRDRMVSVHQPEMRHGRKSSSRRFDGHKAAIVAYTDSQLITAGDVLPNNAPDNLGTLDLMEESKANTGAPPNPAGSGRSVKTSYLALHPDWQKRGPGDAAYGCGGTRQAFADAGRTLIARAPGRPTGLTSRKRTSRLTWNPVPAPVRRGKLPGESGLPALGPTPRAEHTG